MSLPDLLKDVDSASGKVRNPSTSSKGSKLEPCKPKRSRSSSQRETLSPSPDFEWETDSMHSFDEGEAAWDALGRMSSIRRSNRFDKPQLLTVELRRDHEGFGLELEGKAPPIIHAVAGVAEAKGLRAGDRLLEINGISVRDASHQEAGRLIAGDGSESAIILAHTVKPLITPSGQIVHSGWLYKKGGSGITPRNWRRRWFVVRDDCVAYYYPSPEDIARPLGAIVLHNYTISKASVELKRPFSFQIVRGGARTYYFAADTEPEMNLWAQVFTEAANLEHREQVHITGSAKNISVSALSIKDPECHGFLYKQGRGLLSWKRTYCVLKCKQMFFYSSMSNRTAQSVLNVEGYQIVRGKSKDKKFYFHVSPPTKDLKPVHFFAETGLERERWIESIIQSTQASVPLSRPISH